MRKSGIFIFGAALSFALLSGNARMEGNASVLSEGKQVYIGGQAAGFTLKTGEIQVIGICDVLTENGAHSPAQKTGLRTGDRIVKIAAVPVKTVEDLNDAVNAAQGKSVEVEIKRKNETFTQNIQPIQDKTTGKYKIGVLVRDSVSGIGTITYIDGKNGDFGALGHTVTDEEKQEMTMENGVVYACSVVGVRKGVRGKAGELRGMFLNDQPMGSAEKLSKCGIFGKMSGNWKSKKLKSAIASSEGAKPGKAYIYSTVNGVCPKRYTIEIVKVDKSNRENKNYVIKITDDELLSETGGIVQGMSGSPIIQEDKLVGAVTHVFLNDPTRGYGIDIEKMMEN